LLDQRLIHDILTLALSTGADFAEIFLENTESNLIALTNGLVEKANWGIDHGCGLRIIYGGGGGYTAIYAYTNRTDRESLLNLVREAAQAVQPNDSGKIQSVLTLNRLTIPDRHPVSILPSNANKKEIVDRLRSAAAAATDYNSLITQTRASYSSVIQNILIANSAGLFAEDRRIRTLVSLDVVASSSNEKQTANFRSGTKRGYEFVESLDFPTIGRSVAQTAVTMLKADLCPSGRMPVLIDNGFGGVIFHEACGHSLEATFIAKKNSVFADKLNQQIAAPIVTAIDDGTLPNEWGSNNIDDEGTPTRRNILIENGILKSYLVDYLNGLKMNTPSTGSSRRQSYQFAPTSRMTNTFIAPGTESPESIIADTDFGLYAKQMGGGSVQPATGEFNFAVLEAYMIRHGKIAEPVRGATLIGKGSEVLMNIDRVANNLKLVGCGMCGSISGSAPVDVGQPLIRVKQMTVGGRK